MVKNKRLMQRITNFQKRANVQYEIEVELLSITTIWTMSPKFSQNKKALLLKIKGVP